MMGTMRSVGLSSSFRTILVRRGFQHQYAGPCWATPAAFIGLIAVHMLRHAAFGYLTGLIPGRSQATPATFIGLMRFAGNFSSV